MMMNLFLGVHRRMVQLLVLLSGLSLSMGGSVASAQVVMGGPFNTVVLKADGTVWGWGYNANGQLGNGTSFDSYTPVQVKGLSAVKSVAMGSGHTVALRNDGTVWTWGSNANGQLGNGSLVDSYTPIQVTPFGQVYVSIATGRFHTVALRNDGTVWTWGYNRVAVGYGPASNPATVTTQGTTPRLVPGLTGVISIYAGADQPSR